MTINNTQITEFSLDQLGDNFAAGLIGISLTGIAKLGKAQAEVSEAELEGASGGMIELDDMFDC